MEEAKVTRKLAVVLYADVAGYTRLTDADEEATHRALSDSLDAITAAIEDKGGQVLHYAGDAILAEFSSVVVAVACAIEIQRDLAARNHGLPEDRKLQYRIGVNLGDVIVDRNELYGDGVNIAARLESLADPGGICISRKVLEEVRGRLEVGFQFLGDQAVKNVERPIPVYKVLIDPAQAGQVIGERPALRSTQGRFPLIAAAAVVLAVASGVAIWRPWTLDVELASAERLAFPLPDKPSIAVLPFDNISDDPKQDYFADGMTEDLITDLSKISGLFVIARNSSFVYKGKSVKVERVARELGVRYVLEGSVRKAGGNIRINVQLIDAFSGGHLWAERYDGNLGDVFALQDQITKQIVSALALKLTAGEELRAIVKETVDPAAYDAFLQGWEHFLRFTPKDFEIAVSLFEKALALDPEYARANAALAATYWQSWKRQWHRNVGFTHAAWARADKYLSMAMIKPSSLAHQVSSEMLTINRRYVEAVAEAKKAISLDPNRAPGYVTLAEALTFAGKADEAIEPINKAMRFDPHSPAAYLLALGRAQFALTQFEEAAATLERAVRRNPNEQDALMILIAAYGHLGRGAQAADAIVKLNAMRKESGLSPFTLETLRNRLPYKDRADRDSLFDGLRKAKLPEW